MINWTVLDWDKAIFYCINHRNSGHGEGCSRNSCEQAQQSIWYVKKLHVWIRQIRWAVKLWPNNSEISIVLIACSNIPTGILIVNIVERNFLSLVCLLATPPQRLTQSLALFQPCFRVSVQSLAVKSSPLLYFRDFMDHCLNPE